MIIKASEAQSISKWNAGLAGPVSIRFISTLHPKTADFKAFLDSLSKQASRLEVIVEKEEGNEPPALKLGTGLVYRAIPTGTELEPFLEALGMLQEGQALEASIPLQTALSQLPEKAAKLLLEMEWPAQIKVYVTPQCPFCPRVVSRLQPLSLANPRLELSVIDGSIFPEMAARDGVKSVPTTILDSRFRWTGLVEAKEVVDALINRDPSRLGASTLKSMLKEGNAAQLAEMMLKSETVFPAYIELMLDSDWSVRLGAMVVAEEIGKRNSGLAQDLLAELWKHAKTVKDAVRGDMVYLIGSLGSKEWVPELERLLASSESEEMQEIVKEAVEKLRSSVHPGNQT